MKFADKVLYKFWVLLCSVSLVSSAFVAIYPIAAPPTFIYYFGVEYATQLSTTIRDIPYRFVRLALVKPNHQSINP